MKKLFTILICAICLCTNAQVCFNPATNFSASTHPFSITNADFNRDGIVDLAIANYSSSNVSILLGTGTGSFGAATNFPTGNTPNSIISADFNGDGIADLAVTNESSSNVSVLLGTGTGSFGATTNFAVGANPRSVISADFNGDGIADLAVANQSSNSISVLLGTGTGSFGAATNFAVSAQPLSVISADFNGDGKADLATNSYTTNNVSILLGTGTGSFGTATNFAVGVNPWEVTKADFNGDGITDLAIGNSGSNNVSVLLGTGTGSFGTATNFAVGVGPRTVTVADFNGDGKADLVTGNIGSANVSVILGTGTGSFGAANNFAVGTSPEETTIADFNGDGKVDMAVVNYNTSNVSVLLNCTVICTGSYGTANSFVADSNPISVTSADFNGDGKADLAVTNWMSDDVSILLGTGTGNFGAATNFTAGIDPRSITSADFNRDGKIDLAVANYSSNTVSILLGTGTGSFGAATNFAVGSQPFSVKSADFNGDGIADLAVANYSSNTVSILLGTGTGSFGVATGFAAASNPVSITIADFNRDGKTDLAIANFSSNNVSVLLGTGTGSFGAATNFAAGAIPYSITCADFNRDGKVDLAVVNQSSNNVSVLLGTGTGSFGAASNFAVGTNPLSITSADYNRDGKADLAVTNSDANNVSVLLGTGAGTFSAATNFAAGSLSYSITSADFNGDGKTDLAMANYGTTNVSVLLNTILPNLSAGIDQVVCAGTSVTLSGSGASTYAWSNGVIDGTPFTPLTTTTYTVTGTDGGGCTNTDNVVVTVNPLPVNISITNGLVAYYPFNNNANDESGNGNNGTLTGGPLAVADRNSNPNSAYNFDGIDDYILVNDPVPTSLQIQNEITLSAWIYVTQYPAVSTLGLIVGSQCDFCGGSRGASIFLDGRTNPDGQIAPPGHIHFQIGDGSWHGSNTNSQVPLNQWVHIVATRKANEDAKIYYNGVLQPLTSVAWTGSVSYTGAYFAIGRQRDYGDRFFKGSIDEVRVYKRALSQSEVTTLYQENVSLVAYATSNTICQNNSTNIELVNSENGVSYQLQNSGIDIGSAQSGNGGILTFNTGNLTSTSTFALKATDNITACNIILDTIITIKVNPVYSFTENHSICSGDIYHWQGNDYTVANTYTANYTSINGCDSIYTLNLTVNPNLPVSVSIAASANPICAGTSVTFTANPTNGGTVPGYQWRLNGIIVGTNSPTYTNAALVNGDKVKCWMSSNAICATGSPALSNIITMSVNSVLPVNVSIIPSANSICPGSNVIFTATPTNGGSTPSYQWLLNGSNVGTDNATYSTTGLANGDIVTCVLTSNITCSSGNPANSNAVTMTVNAVYTFTENHSICNGDNYLWQGNYFTTANTYTASYTSINGCDSIYTLNLSVNPVYAYTESYTICNGDTYHWRGNDYTTANTYNAIYTSINGCDSIYTLHLSVSPPYVFTENHSICSGDTYHWQGNDYTNANTYTANYTSINGCDSIYTLNLVVSPVYAFTESHSICDGDTYHWQGSDYTIANTYTANYTSINGCDSIYTLHLTVNPIYAFTENHSICNGDTYHWQGNDYTSTNTYTANYTSIHGCDSIYTLNLSVSPVYAFTENHSICNGDTYHWQGNDYTSANTYTANYTSINGCDSIYTLNLSVSPVYAFTENHSICNGDTYHWQGNDYTSANTYTANYTSINGCDSIYTLNLAVNPVYAFTENHSMCNGETYNWQGTDYSTANTYTANYTSINSCDSMYTLNLSVNTVDTSLTVSDPTITANASGAIYQWLDCDNAFAIIPGATSQVFNAIANGNYAVIVTQGLCSDTSSCAQILTIGIMTTSNVEGITVYPNPVSDELIIESKGNQKEFYFEIFNSIGQVVFKENVVEKAIVKTSNFDPGVYYIRALFNDSSVIRKVIKL